MNQPPPPPHAFSPKSTCLGSIRNRGWGGVGGGVGLNNPNNPFSLLSDLKKAMTMTDDDQSVKDGTVAGRGNGGWPLLQGDSRVGNTKTDGIQMKI